MTRKTFETGETVFEEGAAADFVGYVLEGEAEVIKRHGEDTIVLGHVGREEYVGEMAALEGRAHSATIRATAPLTLEIASTVDFLAVAAANNEIAHNLLLRLSARLRQANRAFADAVADRRPDAAATPPAPEVPPLSAHTVRLLAGSSTTEVALAKLGDRPIALPFVVGRMPMPGEAPPVESLSLQIRDSRPFRLSRSHFAIDGRDGAIWIHDLDSHLGTIVNGRGIGSSFGADSERLHPGENTVVAGGMQSPYVFRVLIDE